MRLFTRREVAAAFGVSPLRITKWTAAGMPVADRGQRGKQSRYDLAAVVTWRVETEVQRRTPAVASGAGDGAGPAAASINLGIERAKLARVQTRMAELNVRRREGELLEAEEVTRTWSLIVIAIRSRLLALPRAMADRLVAAAQGAQPEALVEGELRGEVREILRELAGWKGEEPPPPPAAAPAPEPEAVAS